MRHPALLTAALLLATLVHPRDSRAGQQELNGVWKTEFPIATRADVRIVADDGHVYLHSRANAKTVAVRVTYDLKKWGKVWGARKPDVRFDHQGDIITISVREPGNLKVMGGVVEKLEIHVTLPVACDVSIRTDDGGVDSDPITGRVKVETQDGHLRLHGVRGEITLASSDGRITADELDGIVRVRTGDGAVSLIGRMDVLAVRTGDGRVEATAIAGSKMAEQWSVETGDGSILMRIPADLKSLLDLQTQDGRIRVELPLPIRGTQRGHALRGELNGGGPLLRMRTQDGSVTLALAP